MQGGARRRVFRSLAGNRALVRVLAAYVMFGLTEAAVWIAMLVYAYGRGGATTAGMRTDWAGRVAVTAVAATTAAA